MSSFSIAASSDYQTFVALVLTRQHATSVLSVRAFTKEAIANAEERLSDFAYRLEADYKKAGHTLSLGSTTDDADIILDWIDTWLNLESNKKSNFVVGTVFADDWQEPEGYIEVKKRKKTNKDKKG